MKLTTFYLILLFGPCFCVERQNKELDRYALTIGQKKLIPYSEGQSLKLKNSQGADITLYVAEIKTESIPVEVGECSGNYSSFEQLTTRLQGYPFELELIVQTTKNSSGSVALSINKKYFFELFYDPNLSFYCTNQDQVTCFDTLVISGKEYKSVVECRLTEARGIDGRPEAVVYNSEFGLLQIKMTKGETFTLIP